MTTLAAAEGAAAFDSGAARGTNPYDPNMKEWHHWREGWDQANAAAQHEAIVLEVEEPASVLISRSQTRKE